MEKSSLTTTLMPIALGTIMLGLGLSLSIADFRRVTLYPKAITIAMVCQMILLPALCFGLVIVFKLEPALCVGLMLLSASPGGATANLYSHLSHGDVALNISLTAINSVLTLFTLPLIVNFSLSYFMNSDQYVPMQFIKIVEVFAVVLSPVLIGMLIRSKKPAFAARMDKPVKILSVLFLLLVIISVTLKERNQLADMFASLGLPVLCFNLLSMLMGYYLPMIFKVEKKQAIAIGLEIGIHNGTLAIYIALNVINNSSMSIPPAIYSLIMFVTAAAFGFLVNVGRKTV
ncbi:MAG: bile acid:sodium symporter family protein [Cyclobacteriaceae bacterium]|nr:bile acid:sodium symporter family protein [Cyclobacteriaceae bacterium]